MVKSIHETLKTGISILESNYIESALLDAQILLCHILNCDKSHLIIHKNDKISADNYDKYIGLINKRARNMPVKYLTGICEFYSLDFEVNENVLIPRPDTEIIIDTALAAVDKKQKIKILDLCSGSGCIGITLANLYKESFVTLVELSDGAIRISEKNIEKHNLKNRIKIYKKDILKETIDGQFDIIVSNPPYINENDFENLEPDVKNYEPEMALISPQDEYKFYKRIIDVYSKNLAKNGIMLLEMGYNQSEYLYSYALNSEFFSEISIIKDLSGINRVLYLKKI